MDLAIEGTSCQVAGGAAERVAEAIFAGMHQSREMLVKSREEEL
jgi:hypothetical protein